MGRWQRGTGGRRAAAHRWSVLFPPDNAAPGLLDLGAPADESSDPADESTDAAEERTRPEDPSVLNPDAGAGRRRREDRPRLAISVRLGAVLAALLATVCASWWGVAQGTAPAAVPVGAPTLGPGSTGPRAAGPQASSGAPGPAGDAPAGNAPEGDGPTVHVAGAVAAPGVYRLAPGARVHEAIAAAGGAKPGADLDRLNLAAPVEDGTRLRVPLRGEPEEGQAAGGTAAAAPGSGTPQKAGSAAASGRGAQRKVDINAATAEDLGALPRVGPVLAQRIVDYRTAHGRFAAPEDLDAVSGIGPKMLESLLPLVTAG